MLLVNYSSPLQFKRDCSEVKQPQKRIEWPRASVTNMLVEEGDSTVIPATVLGNKQTKKKKKANLKFLTESQKFWWILTEIFPSTRDKEGEIEIRTDFRLPNFPECQYFLTFWYIFSKEISHPIPSRWSWSDTRNLIFLILNANYILVNSYSSSPRMVMELWRDAWRDESQKWTQLS